MSRTPLWTAVLALWAASAWAGQSIIVDKSENLLWLKDGDHTVKRYVVSTGRDNSTPVGTFKIINKLKDPTWYRPGGGVYKAGDKRNEIGTRWMGLSKKGYGIHGTIEPEALGKQVSHGCIRMKNEEIEQLFQRVSVGTPVTIKD